MSIASPWGPVRLTTVAAAALAFAIVALRTRRPGLALLVVVACLWTYEVVWNATDIAVHGWSWMPEGYWLMLAAGWTGWMLSRGWVPSLRLLAAFAAAHLAWLAAGFPYNFAGRPWTWAGEAWNVGTKSLWLLAWSLGCERRPRLDPLLGRLRRLQQLLPMSRAPVK
ncbi:MAG TPA: hypothetical protein VLW53_11655 [Candidatus Eisenbacteria bacterium]|nr:hypothetical protein [Candidatus Eisenbacteria bacterium]